MGGVKERKKERKEKKKIFRKRKERKVQKEKKETFKKRRGAFGKRKIQKDKNFG